MFFYQDVEVMDTGKATYTLLQRVIIVLRKSARKESNSYKLGLKASQAWSYQGIDPCS